MEKIVSILEEKGLFSSSCVEKFAFSSPWRKVRDTIEELQSALDERAYLTAIENNPLSAFNFLASASLRGESCDALQCRLDKIFTLARYAALYCDRVLIPIQLKPVHDQHESEIRYDLYRNILCILELRPLIEGGIIFLLPSFLNYCPHCMPIVVPERPDISNAARMLADAHISDFKLVYERDGKRGYPITLKGPSAFLEHGQTFRRYSQRPAWFPKSLTYSPLHREVDIDPSLVRESKWVEDVFNDMAEDATLQQFYGLKYDTKYLTDRQGEAEFLAALNTNSELTSQSKLCAQLAHNIPLLSEASIETIVKIRRDDNEAFQQYRSTLGEIVKKYVASGKEVGESQAKEIFFDELQPRLRELERKAQTQRRDAIKKSMIKASITTVTVGLGVYSGILPSQLLELCKAIGGVKLVSDLAEAVSSLSNYPAEVRNNNLYFLLRVKEEMQKQ